MAKKVNYEVLAKQVLELVGGKQNISSLSHCVTRLRFTLKDLSLANAEEIKKLDGVIGCQFSNGQCQVIIGPAVKKAYEKVCEIGQFDGDMQVAPAKDGNKKHGLKEIFSLVITSLSSCVVPVLPIFVCAGLLKMITTVFGPTMLGLLDPESGIFTVLTFAGDAGFYFLPIFLGYTSAKQFKANPFIGMLMGAVLVSPAFSAIVTAGTPLDIFGIPVGAVSYASSVVPIILIVWVMSYVEKFFAKFIPDMFQQMLVPLCTVLIMLPLGLCLLGPLGNILSGYISAFFLGIYDIFGPIGLGIIASLFLPLIITGMHHALNMACLAVMMTVGYDQVVFVAATAATISVMGVMLAFSIKAKKTDLKSLGFSGFILQTLGGVVEPSLYGVLLPYRKPFIAQAIGAFAGAVYMGFAGVKFFTLTGSNILILVGFVGGTSMNLINALIGSGIAFVVGFIATWLLGFDEK